MNEMITTVHHFYATW